MDHLTDLGDSFSLPLIKRDLAKAGDPSFPTATFDEARKRKFSKGKLNYHFHRKRTGRPMAEIRPKKEATKVDRMDAELEAAVLSDPMGVIQKQFARMMVSEIIINDDLYTHEHVDSGALTASNKRLVDLGEALKALPKQQPLVATGAQRSAAEVIQQAHDRRKSLEAPEDTSMKLDKTMINRASTAFGEGA